MTDQPKKPHASDTYTPQAAEAAGKRAEATREERRRRADVSYESRAPLDWPPHLLADKDYKYHTFNDEPGRIKRYTTEDDWDLVRDPHAEAKDTEGSMARKPIGTFPNGQVKYGYLARKRMEYWKADFAKRQARLDDTDAQIRRGRSSSPQALSTDQPHAYVPSTGMSMTGDTKEPGGYKP